jgi:hypothetical protein
MQAIESWSTGQGVPDMNLCLEGSEVWIENKQTSAWALAHPLTPEQVGWIERRARAGGRVFIAVRRQCAAGIRRGPAVDELYIFRPDCARALAATNSIKDIPPSLGPFGGGPSRWDWVAIKTLFAERRD